MWTVTVYSNRVEPKKGAPVILRRECATKREALEIISRVSYSFIRRLNHNYVLYAK